MPIQEPEERDPFFDRARRAVAVTVTGEPYGQTRRTVLLAVIAVALFLAPTFGAPVAVFGLVALVLLALEGKR